MSVWDSVTAAFGRRAVKLTDPAGWNLDIGSWAGKSVTPDSVLQLATAWSCVRLNSRTIASLPIKVYEKTRDGSRRTADDHPLYALLHDTPNGDQTALEFWEGQITALNLRGNAFAEIARGGDNRVIALLPMNPDLVTVYRDPAGQRCYRYSPARGPQREMNGAQVFHLRGFGAGGDQGLSPISYGRQTLGTALAADETAGRTFSNGLQLAGFVEMATGTKVTAEKREELVKLFAKFAGSPQAGKIMPLDPGMKFSALGMSPEDAQLLETRGFHVEEICRWFGVMPVLIGHASAGQTMWGSGIEQIVLAWLTLALGPELTRIEQAIEKQLMAPQDRAAFYVEHNQDALLRADTTARAALYSVQAQNGLKSRNEIRARENDPPMPGGDMLTVQSNLVPLDKLGTTPPRAVQPAPGEPV